MNTDFENSVSIQIRNDVLLQKADPGQSDMEFELTKGEETGGASSDDGPTLTTADGSGDSENLENPGPDSTKPVEMQEVKG